MANPLTGDFEAVLQISGNTINRLLATLHQNAFTKPNLPSFPHMIRMRIGDDHAIDGVRGLVFGQIAVPRIHLIHGVTDRFQLEVGVRVWYRPDPGTNPLPTYINGTVLAEYHLMDIDPHCIGWSKLASEYLWIRVVKESVTFQGSGEDELNLLAVSVPGLASDPAAVSAANIAKITKQIAGQLATRFEATPHPVSKRFRRGSLRSLNAPIGGSAVALPIGLSGEPVGNINSIDNLLLEGSDLAVGVNLGYIMSLTAPVLDEVKKIAITVPVHKDLPLKDFDTVYHVGVNPPTVEWEPHGSYALFKVAVHGWANTSSIAANATFDIAQNIMLDFNAGDSKLHLTPFSPGVYVHSSGLYSGTVAGAVKDAVLKVVPPIVQAACNNVQPALDAMTTPTPELSQQLRTFDDQATISLDEGLFLRDGIILRGTIALTSRQGMVIKTGKTAAQDAHTALESWIPGGRIDKFEWSWSWAGSGDPGHLTYTDRFLLRRPGAAGRWGMGIGLKSPLPGLDGWGTVCLKISGVRVDSVTGEFVPVQSSLRCTRFGLNISDGIRTDKRLFLRDMPELSKPVPFPQLALVSPRRTGTVGAANTLVLYVDRAWDHELAATLERGLEACRRYDAGLAVLVLFREGILESAGPDLVKDVEGLARKIGIAALVNEDVHGGWTRALALKAGAGEPGWAIVTPEGAPAWTHQGRITPEDLGSALDTHLRRCADAKPVAFQIAAEVGNQVAAAALYAGLFDLAESQCPPPPLGRLGVEGAVIAFVQKGSAASEAKLRALLSQHEEQERQGNAGALVVAVIDGADAREAQAMKEQLNLDFVPIPDRSGTITNRFGIGVWPTTMMLDDAGVIWEIETGVAARPVTTHTESAV